MPGASTPNEPPDFAWVETVFHQIIGQCSDDPAGRARLVREACADRPDLAGDLASLVDAHDRLTAVAPEADGEEPGVGAVVGSYRLVERIGRGGMGDVYRAERTDGIFDHQVAVKVARSTDMPAEARSRFGVERQVLASLRHPHIVRLFDGGTLPGGRAYFVMELVPGVRITTYCGEHSLSLEARVRLIRAVCEAVQHAHQHGIVHRDLKPANVLVTAEDAPKVLDFGVAKLLEGPVAAGSTTGLLAAPLTPNYASPEQLRGVAVTTASDVYALGVLLYEVIAGVRPYETAGEPLDRVLEIVLQTLPPRPSTAPGGESLPYSRRRLRGDLDAIALKALSKDGDRRYASASELAADLARWLDGEPVQARGPSTAYVLGRVAARHRLAVAMACVAVAGIAAASAVAWWQAQVARREQARAERRFNDVREIASRVIFDYQAALRELTGASDLRARMLADALRYLDALAAEGPAPAELQLEIARGYINVSEVQGSARLMNLGDPDGATASLRKAEALLTDLVARVPGFGRAAFSLAAMPCYYARVDAEHAVDHARRCVAGVEPWLTRRPEDTLVRLTLAQALTRLAEAGSEDDGRRAIALLSGTSAEAENGQLLVLTLAYAHRLVGWRVLERGDAAGALRHGEAAAAALAPVVERTGGGERHMDHAFTHQLIGRSALALGDRQRARSALEEALRLIQTAFEGNPRDAFVQNRLLQAYQMLALGLEQMGDRAAASGVYRDAVRRMPSLTAILDSPDSDVHQGLIYAGHAQLGFPRPPCHLLRASDRHLARARLAGRLSPPQVRRADWVRTSLAQCATFSE